MDDRVTVVPASTFRRSALWPSLQQNEADFGLSLPRRRTSALINEEPRSTRGADRTDLLRQPWHPCPFCDSSARGAAARSSLRAASPHDDGPAAAGATSETSNVTISQSDMVRLKSTVRKGNPAIAPAQSPNPGRPERSHSNRAHGRSSRNRQAAKGRLVAKAAIYNHQ